MQMHGFGRIYYAFHSNVNYPHVIFHTDLADILDPITVWYCVDALTLYFFSSFAVFSWPNLISYSIVNQLQSIGCRLYKRLKPNTISSVFMYIFFRSSYSQLRLFQLLSVIFITQAIFKPQRNLTLNRFKWALSRRVINRWL